MSVPQGLFVDRETKARNGGRRQFSTLKCQRFTEDEPRHPVLPAVDFNRAIGLGAAHEKKVQKIPAAGR